VGTEHILDEIDGVLASHYGFTDEELEFIINYDLKYRMGEEAEVPKGAGGLECASGLETMGWSRGWRR
jgi:hypothetical protein